MSGASEGEREHWSICRSVRGGETIERSQRVGRVGLCSAPGKWQEKMEPAQDDAQNIWARAASYNLPIGRRAKFSVGGRVLLLSQQPQLKNAIHTHITQATIVSQTGDMRCSGSDLSCCPNQRCQMSGCLSYGPKCKGKTIFRCNARLRS